MTSRSAGVLLHVTSLPGPFGIGDLGHEAEQVLRWMRSAGQSAWQLLPVGPTGAHDSPYSPLSTFAGNPLLVSPKRLNEDGLLEASSLEGGPCAPPERVDYAAVLRWKTKLLRQAWEKFRRNPAPELRRAYERFSEDPLHRSWLDDWSLFASLRARARGRRWSSWDPELKLRDPGAIRRVRLELAGEIGFRKFVQFLFFRQWALLREAANRSGILLIGDLPIYVAQDSADVWANQPLFQLDGEGRPTKYAGVPPDYFSADGQLWRQPLYRWEEIERDGFSWWIERVRWQLTLFDVVRLDHFRGFAAYWEVPATERSATRGRWVLGPGARLFDALRDSLGGLPLIAEDLGEITPDVHRLRRELGLPGMKVLQFAFDDPDSDHLPRHHAADSVVYTGTHDNDTVRGWFENLDDAAKKRVLDCLGCSRRSVVWALIGEAYRSVGFLAIVPVQDLFGLGGEARMNRPGVSRGNWTWRAVGEQFDDAVAARLFDLAGRTDRTS